jgi:hypothetical protein
LITQIQRELIQFYVDKEFSQTKVHRRPANGRKLIKIDIKSQK